MSNAPDRYEKFVVPEGVSKIAYQKDERLPDAGTFIIQREDHTIGNVVRTQLLKDPTVTFAGYKIPHPLEHQMLIKIRTNGEKTPPTAMKGALKALESEIKELKEEFQRNSRR